MGIPILTFAAALGCGLVAGVFYAFSAFVMRALARLPPAQGIAAMQSINVAVLNPWFLGVFLGTAAAGVALAIAGALGLPSLPAMLRLAGGLLYVAGTLGVTMAANVPRNDRLARIDPASADGERFWSEYVADWTLWNHVRTAAALAAAALLTRALWLEGAP